jgi:hypothetical protein
MPDSEMNQESKPLWLGLCLAPLVAPILFVALGLVVGADKTSKQEFSGFESWRFWMLVFGAVAVLSYVETLTFGAVIVALLKHFGKLTFWPLVSLSAFTGSLTLASFMCVLGWNEKHLGSAVLWFAAYGLVLGCGVASSFCWITGLTSRAAPSTPR